MTARLQAWLQTHPWPLWRIGNALSTLRYWTWVARGSKR